MWLYMFNVDVGTMMKFDVSFSVGPLSQLQEHIAKVHNIPVNMQVLLVSGGITLPSDQPVGHFSAGTDTNPIFLYNKKYYDLPNLKTPEELLKLNRDPDPPDMKASLISNLLLPDTVQTVARRSCLAQKYSDIANAQAEICERLVYEQHLQHQAYSAVIANMDDTIPTVEANLDQYVSYFQEYFDNKQHFFQLSETVSELAQTLASIPLLPSLVDLAVQDPLTSVTSCQELSQRKENASLLDWLHLRNSSDSLQKLSQMCSRGIQKHNEELVSSLQTVLQHAKTKSQDEYMRNIKGLSDRFSMLDELLEKLRTHVQYQASLAQAFQKNLVRVNDSKDVSVLPDICDSHRKSLEDMQTKHSAILDIRDRITNGKKELIENIHIRLKWVYSVETEVARVGDHTRMYLNSLKLLKEQLNILEQTHNIPHLYLTAVAEVVRRRTFSHAFLVWANDLAFQLCAVHSEEVARRQNFRSQFDGHMLNNLFPGLEDSPPSYATQAPEPFDTKLPKLTIEDLETIKRKVADFALSVSMPDLNSISEFFISTSIKNPMKPKEVKRLLEEVTAMEQPTENQAAGVDYLASVVPITDRGFESETDTEEFEKVGQSPTDMAFEKGADSTHEDKARRLNKAKEEMQKSIVTFRSDLTSVREWLASEHGHIHSFLEQISTAYQKDVDQKSQKIYELRQELSEREEEVIKIRARTEELEKRLAISVESENREREFREQVELAKERAVKETTEKLAQEHRMEMEAVRARFRLMTTASVERDLSELNLDKMSLDSEETVAQVRAELMQEKERAVAEERQRWQNKLDHEMTQLKIRAEAERQIWLNETMRHIVVEKDRQMENLRMHSVHIETECQKHRDTIHRLTGTSGSLGSESSLLERVEALEAAKVKLEAELAEARRSPVFQHSTPTHQDMSTSIALCDGSVACLTQEETYIGCHIIEQDITFRDSSFRDAATSPDPVRKTQLKEKLTKSTTSLIQQGKVNIGSCNIGETVLVVWEENYHSYMILQESTTLYFLHPDSLADMSLFLMDGSPRFIYSLAEVVEKEYCHARKPTNRYNVAKGTKFYRVKVRPLAVLPNHSQSSSGCSA